jgi:hypothetical protein
MQSEIATTQISFRTHHFVTTNFSSEKFVTVLGRDLSMSHAPKAWSLTRPAPDLRSCRNDAREANFVHCQFFTLIFCKRKSVKVALDAFIKFTFFSF